ncbi:MAG TPA: type II toxin-antitoxin system VapC family toxin [Candidatus Competibacteraceae bacterium]|nr:type II toxin-antitoxin system VapC family toxin [Candidatus Competibacteraceae bacterium]
MRVLLDTCTFLWLITGSEKLSEQARRAFSDPANEVYLSAVSPWELLVKQGLGKFHFPLPVEEIVGRFRESHRIAPLPLDEASVFHLARLPPLHRDPFDRMLVCQAIQHGLTLLTPDPLIRQYPISVLW